MRRHAEELGVSITEMQSLAEEEDIPISITYESNGNCTPYRVIVRSVGEGEDAEGAVVSISRSGKPQIEDEDEWRRRRR